MRTVGALLLLPLLVAPLRADGPGRVDVRPGVERRGDEAVVRLDVEVQPGWHLYGLRSEHGVPPRLELELPAGVTALAPLAEPRPAAELALGELPITAHRGSIAFVQTLSLAGPGPVRLAGRFSWQVCDDPDRYCAPGGLDLVLIVGDRDGRAPGEHDLGGGEQVRLTGRLDDGLLRFALAPRAGGPALDDARFDVDARGAALEGPARVVRDGAGLRGEVRLRRSVAGQALLDVRWSGRDARGREVLGRCAASLPFSVP